jgi:phospholipid transport system substrate-binding protein
MTMKFERFIDARVITLFVMVFFFTSSAWAGPATDNLKATFDKIIKVLNDPSLKVPEKEEEKRDILRKIIKERFDEEEFAKRALGAHWKKRTKEEKEEFTKLFSILLERTIYKKVDKFLTESKKITGENILYSNEKVKGRYAVVETMVITYKNSEIPVHYRFINKGGDWIVCDLAIEGVSLVKNYRVQFNEILANSSFKDLIAMLKAKEQKEK